MCIQKLRPIEIENGKYHVPGNAPYTYIHTQKINKGKIVRRSLNSEK